MYKRTIRVIIAVGILTISGGIIYAQGPGGNPGTRTGGTATGMSGHMNGGYGMMGGHMMNDNSMMPNPNSQQPNNRYSPTKHNQKIETTRLREEIHQKRQELSDLYRSGKPDNELLDKKVRELNRLEAELDRQMAESSSR